MIFKDKTLPTFWFSGNLGYQNMGKSDTFQPMEPLQGQNAKGMSYTLSICVVSFLSWQEIRKS